MVVKKSPGGSKTPRSQQKPTPKKSAVLEEVEFDEEDDDDLEFEDDAELDEGDEELDDEESVDDEEEELEEGDSEEEEEPEVAPLPKHKQGQPQKTPTKRKAEDDTSSPAKRVRLEDYIPASQVLDYSERDARTLLLTGFDNTVKFEEVEKLCKGAAEVRGRKKTPLTALFVMYSTSDDAQAAAKRIQNSKLKGKSFTAQICSTLHTERKSSTDFMLDVRNIPRRVKRAQFKALFPGSKLECWYLGYAKVSFDSPAQLVNAIKNPRCHSIQGEKLQFSYSLDKPGKKLKSEAAAMEKQKVESTEASATPADKGKGSAGAKTPAKKAAAVKTPSPSKGPKALKLSGGNKSPLPKQKFQTPKQSPKGTPKARKSTGKKQKA